MALQGVKVIELAGLAPVPFAGMVLSDFGASVIRIDRPGTKFNPDILSRGKRSISISLKSKAGIDLLKSMLSSSDVLIDPFRPGVLERLGLNPSSLLELNPRLIIVRLTGFQRSGSYSNMAGHDINYAALSGVLSMLGRKGEKPMFPTNILADFAGGGMIAVVGILIALYEREKSGKGQIIEVDMVTGLRYVSSFPLLMSRPELGLPIWDQPRGENVLDGGSPWYEVYATLDNQFMTVGAIEPQFYSIFLNTFLANVDPSLIPSPTPEPSTQNDRETWPALTEFFTQGFASKTREEWTNIFIGTDACVAPVLNANEVDSNGFGRPDLEDGGIPAAAPRLTRTPAQDVNQFYKDGNGFFLEAGGQHTREIMKEFGLEERIEELLKDGTIEASSEVVKAKL